MARTLGSRFKPFVIILTERDRENIPMADLAASGGLTRIAVMYSRAASEDGRGLWRNWVSDSRNPRLSWQWERREFWCQTMPTRIDRSIEGWK